jgi:ABC-type methionine transport system ATPase subunit
MPLLRIRGVSAEEASDRTRSMLEFVGLPDLGDFPVYQLDHTTQQHIALIRALIHQPKILIAISPFPTILPIARLAAHEMGITVICTGEEDFLAANCDRLFVMKNGVLSENKSGSIRV